MDTDILQSNLLDDLPPIGGDGCMEGAIGSGSNDIGDMTFCMGNYISDFMKVSPYTIKVTITTLCYFGLYSKILF